MHSLVVFACFLVFSVESGVVQKTAGDVEFTAYMGIKFGDIKKRFEPAEFVDSLNATQKQFACVQGFPNYKTESEDCLTLNVYVPIRNGSLPVMFWIYGGGFTTGDNAYETYAPDYFVEQGIIVVAPNYRLNSLGFLKNLNLGFHDVILALKWVQKNINSFFGNPEEVTIFGESAGAALASYLAISPLTKDKGYFKRAIFASGCALNPWATQLHSEDIYKQFLDAVLCDSIKCLQRTSLLLIKMATYSSHLSLLDFLKNTLNGVTFAPVYQEGVIENTYEYLSNCDLEYHVPFIIGVTGLEGIGFEKYFSVLEEFFVNAVDNTSLLVPETMYAKQEDLGDIGDLIQKRYFNGKVTNATIAKFISSVLYDKSMRKYLELTKNVASSSYCYVFNHVPQYARIHEEISNISGIGHAEDIPFYFKNYYGWEMSYEDLYIKDKFVKMWSNFAKTGNPSYEGFTWPQAHSINDNVIRCLDLQLELRVVEDPKQEDYEFWEDLFKTFGNPKNMF